MSPGDESNDDTVEGLVPVQVSSRAVHKAVRNIMQNEMRIDAVELRTAALDAAKAAVTQRVDEYLRGNQYDQAGLEARVRNWTENYLKRDIEAIVATVIEKRVSAFLKEEGLAVVAAVVSKGLTLDIGWRHKVPLKINEVDIPQA